MRIISGKFGSRRLKTLSGNNTRPTEDRVREAVFGRLGPYFDGGIILDLFGGSGAVSLEAISRGFDFAHICDMSREAVSVIYSNINELKVNDQVKVYNSSYKTVLNKLKQNNVKCDLIYIDPPFHQHIEQDALNIIFESYMLKDDGVIVVETDKKDEVFCNSPYTVDKTVVYGLNRITYIKKEKENAESSLSGII